MDIHLQNTCQNISQHWDLRKRNKVSYLISITKQSILPYINLMKELGILEDTDNPLKPYNIVKTKKEITVLMHQYLPDLPAQMTSEQLSNNYLHCVTGDRWHAGNGI